RRRERKRDGAYAQPIYSDASLLWPDAYPVSFQNSPTSPTSRNTDSASVALFGRHLVLRRSPYHSCASFHPWTRESVPPRWRFHCAHQRSTCCSDRNRSMVRQVNATSLYHSR